MIYCLAHVPSLKELVNWILCVGFPCSLQNILHYSRQHPSWSDMHTSTRRNQCSLLKSSFFRLQHTMLVGAILCSTTNMAQNWWKMTIFILTNLLEHPACFFLGTPSSLPSIGLLLLAFNYFWCQRSSRHTFRGMNSALDCVWALCLWHHTNEEQLLTTMSDPHSQNNIQNSNELDECLKISLFCQISLF